MTRGWEKGVMRRISVSDVEKVLEIVVMNTMNQINATESYA